jgi:hypothetical protein
MLIVAGAMQRASLLSVTPFSCQKITSRHNTGAQTKTPTAWLRWAFCISVVFANQELPGIGKGHAPGIEIGAGTTGSAGVPTDFLIAVFLTTAFLTAGFLTAAFFVATLRVDFFFATAFLAFFAATLRPVAGLRAALVLRAVTFFFLTTFFFAALDFFAMRVLL